MIVPKQAGNLAYLADALPNLRKIQRMRLVRASSRTPEGHYGTCPLCGEFVSVTFSDPAGDAPCPACGRLLWKHELRWPFRSDVPTLPLLGRRTRSLAYRVGRLVGRAARRIRGRRPADPVPAPPSASGMYDRWLDG